MKLFLFYIGGDAPGSNIELHDVRFVVAADVEACIPTLKQHWWGIPSSLHLDSYVHLHHVDGWRIELSEQPSMQKEKLWFVNVGGYYKGRIAEYHDFTLVVANSADDAKRIGLSRVLTDALEQHKDDLHDVDNCLAVDMLGGWHVHLIRDDVQQPFEPDWAGYRPIGK